MSSDKSTDSSLFEREEIHRPFDGERQLGLDRASPLPSNRIWQEPMQLLLLKEMVGYSDINGKCKVSLSYISKFHSSLLEGSPLFNFSTNQILEKMKRLKRMYDNFYEGNWKGKAFHPEQLEFSKKLWGETEKDKDKKQKRMKVEAIENDDDDDDFDGDDEGEIYFKDRKVWEKDMVRLMKGYYYKEDFTKLQIASLDELTRNSLIKIWLNQKAKMNTAMFNVRLAESKCLKALLPS